MSEHRYDIRISESCVDPNLFMVERQDPDDFTRFQTRERCALEIAIYVFKLFCNEEKLHLFNFNTYYRIRTHFMYVEDKHQGHQIAFLDF